MSRCFLKTLTCLVGLQFSIGAHAQTHIEEFGEDVLSIHTAIELPSLPLSIESTKSSSHSPALDYQQNAAPQIGLGVDWGDLGVYVALLDLKPLEDVKTYGKTSYFDLQLHFFIENWGLDLVYQHFKGYYLNNTKQVLPSYYAAHGNLIREDLGSFNAGFNLTYLFHPERISYSAALDCSALQQGDGGSWSLTTGFSDQKLSSDKTLAPDDLATDYGELGNVKQAHFRTLAMGGGYGYTWGFWIHWFFHFSLTAEVGPQNQDFTTQSQGTINRWVLAGKGLGRAAFGANGKRYFGGISYLIDETGFQVEDRILNFSSNFASLYFGIRFNI